MLGYLSISAHGATLHESVPVCSLLQPTSPHHCIQTHSGFNRYGINLAATMRLDRQTPWYERTNYSNRFAFAWQENKVVFRQGIHFSSHDTLSFSIYHEKTVGVSGTDKILARVQWRF